MPPDPLAQFKLKLNKSVPPETWSHGRKVTKPSMTSEKVAFDPITAGTFLAGHVLPNLAYKAYKKSPWGKNTEENQVALGIQHALEGREISPAYREFIHNTLGPESLAAYETGHLTGRNVGGRSELERMVRMKGVGKFVSELPNTSKAPIAGALPGAITRVLENGPDKGLNLWKHLPTSELGAKRSLLSRVIPNAAALGAGVAGAMSGNPLGSHLVTGYLGSNILRRLTALKLPGMSESLAEKWTKRGLMKGFTEPIPKTRAGRALNAVKDFGAEALISPAINEPYHIGQAMQKDYNQVGAKAINKAGRALGFNKKIAPTTGQLASFAQNVYNRANAARTPTTPTAAAGMGGLGKAMLLGGGLYALNQAMSPPHERRRREAPQPGYGMVNQY